MITFDERGHLVESYELNLMQFKELFVDKWQPNMSTRPNIFDVFEKYIVDFKTMITPDFIMWVDGSFVTKKGNPRDIDFVSFIDYTAYFKEVKLIDNQFGKYGTKNHYGLLLDGYVSPIYPQQHEKLLLHNLMKRIGVASFHILNQIDILKNIQKGS